MKLLFLLISFTLFLSQLNADRIMITKTSKKNNLSPIKKQLDALQVKMYFKKLDSSYIVYSQDFLTIDEANIVLSRVKHHFTSAYIKKDEKKKHASKKHIEYDYFVSLGLGSSTYAAQESTGKVLDVRGSNYFFEGGYRFNEYSFIALNYLNINSDGGSLNNFSTALNINYPVLQDLDIYTGLLIGFSRLSLDIQNSTPTTSLTVGAQIGISYDFFGYIPVSFSYQYITTSLSVIYPGDVTVEFSPIQNFNLGIGYRF